MNVVPFPGALSTSTFPPHCVNVPWSADNPNPLLLLFPLLQEFIKQLPPWVHRLFDGIQPPINLGHLNRLGKHLAPQLARTNLLWLRPTPEMRAMWWHLHLFFRCASTNSNPRTSGMSRSDIMTSVQVCPKGHWQSGSGWKGHSTGLAKANTSYPRSNRAISKNERIKVLSSKINTLRFIVV